MGAGGAAVAGSLGEGLQGYMGLQQQRMAANARDSQQQLWLRSQLGATSGPEMVALIRAFGGQLTPEQETTLSSLDLVPSSIANQLLGILFKPSEGGTSTGGTVPAGVLPNIIPPDLAKFYEGVDFSAIRDLNLPASTVNALLGVLERLATSEIQEGKSKADFIPGEAVREITQILGLPTKDDITYPSIPVGTLPTFISTLAEQSKPKEEPATPVATGSNLAALTRFLLSGGKDTSALEGITEVPATWGTEIISNLSKTTPTPETRVPPSPEMISLGVTQPLTVDEYSTLYKIIHPETKTESRGATIPPSPEMVSLGVTQPLTVDEYVTLHKLMHPESQSSADIMIPPTPEMKALGITAPMIPLGEFLRALELTSPKGEPVTLSPSPEMVAKGITGPLTVDQYLRALEITEPKEKGAVPTLTATPEMEAIGVKGELTVDQFLRTMEYLASREEEGKGPVRIEPSPEMRARGITQPVTLDEYRTFQDIFAPEDTQTTLTVDTDSLIGEHFPNLVGKEISVDDMNKVIDVIKKVHDIEEGAAESGRKALDWKREFERNQRRRMPQEEAEKIIRGIFPHFEPVMFPDEEGMVDWDEVMEDNKQLAELYKASKDLLYLNYQIEDKQVDIALKRIDLDYKPKLYDSELLLESTQVALDNTRKSQILQDMKFDEEYRPEQIKEIRQRLKQGETMFDIELERAQVQIENMRKEGKLLDAEIPYADDIAKTQAAIMELNFKKLNQELEELPTAAIWAYFGVADPPKIKFYRYQMSEVLEFLNKKRDNVVTVEDVLNAMGIDTSDRRLFSRELLSSYINVDSSLISNIRQAAEIDEVTPANKIQLIAELVNLVSPPLASNLNAGLIAVTNPSLAAQLMQPNIDVLKKISPELYNWAWKTINEAIQEVTGVPVSTPSPPPPTKPAGTVSNTVGNASFEAWYADSLKAVGSPQKILELIPKMDKTKLQQRLKEFGLKSVDDLIALIKKKGGIK